MAQHNLLGDKGEQLALKFLKEKGYQIIDKNWRKHHFEIDIVARDKQELVIVEVKTRSTSFFGEPEEAVTIKKQRHLIEGAHHYIESNCIDLDCRFDVLAIELNKNVEEIKHIKDAFYPEVS